MRLLQCTSSGQLSLTKDFIGNDIPKYAILSHTWGAEEVTFKNLKDSSGKTKDGYKKLRFCEEQAARDGLQFFWVDTCCIDKSSSAELQEAINSMFRWYRNAAKCYVYLSDVSTRKRRTSDQFSEYTWESAFRSSKWFTRGWTLQELLAPGPGLVEFFSREGDRLGDKKTLERLIHEITGIPISALQGTPLSQFNANDRLLWAEKRQTTREEDKSYSLLGIFDIQIPLLYGEGEEKAFKRLREEIDKSSNSGAQNFGLDRLDRLPSAADAPFNSYNKQHEPTCLPNTRVDLLQEIYDWADKEDEKCIFWLNGLAGTGKSTIARTVARKYFEEKCLGASFFFSRGGGDVSYAGKFFTSIAVQLANNIPFLRQYISDAVTKDVASQSLHDQWRQLILGPLSRLDGGLSPICYVLIVDALDECDKEEHIRIILQLLAEVRTLKTVRLRIFLTSRPETPIRHSFGQIPNKEQRDFVLHHIPLSIVDDDIRIFLQNSLKLIAIEQSLSAGWPGEQIIMRLVDHSSGLFIWAATACRFIRDGKRFATKRVNMILATQSSTIHAPEKHLNEIYLAVLRQSIPADATPEEVEGDILKGLLGSIVALFSPLSTQALSKLLDISQDDVGQALGDLHAILDIPMDVSRPLRLHHPSFRDFLLDKKRCSDPNFLVDEKQAHQTLANRCIQLMSTSLKQDICRQKVPGALVSDIQISHIEQCLSPEVRYACLYWIQHLQKGDTQLYDNDHFHQFLQKHFLHWLEALGWIGKSSEGILAILSLESHVQANTHPNLYTFLNDAKRFALYNRSVIEQAPLQLYYSALVFSPENSIIRKQFGQYSSFLIEMKSKGQENWGRALQTLEGHSSWVTSVAFSLDGKQIVSGSNDKTVRLWNAVTGAALQTLECHLSMPTSVAFSPDGKQIISGSANGTMQLWDAVTGVMLQTLEGHLSGPTSVAFSPNGRQIVSGSYSDTIWLWDIITNATVQTFKGHSSWVTAVAFLPNGKQIVSGSYDKTVRLWDIVTGTALYTFESHSRVTSVTFSPDGKQIISGSANGTMQLWDAVTGVMLQTLEGHLSGPTSVAFAPDGKQIVSGSDDKTMRLWDAATGAALQTFKGHLEGITSVAFSPDGKQIVSGSYDETIRLWDAAISTALQTFEGHSSKVRSVAFSLDGKKIVSGSNDKTMRLWDVATGAALQTFKGHLKGITSIAFSPDGKQIVSGSCDDTMRLWDIATSATLQIFKGYLKEITFVAFSPNGKQIVSGSNNNIVQLWDTITATTLQTFKGHLSWITSIAFSPNGKQIVSGSSDNTIWLWDVITGATLQKFNTRLGLVRSVAFSPNGKQIMSGSFDETVQLWDAITGAALQTFKGHSSWVTSVAFPPDSKIEQCLFVSNHWVVVGKQNILWLPPEYRETCQAVRSKVIVLGHSSGRISILELKDRNM